MFSDYTAQAVLNHITGRVAIFALPTAYVALFTTAPTTETGTGGTEVSGAGTAYARVATTSAQWSPATGSGPASISNNTALSFNTATSGWGTVQAFGLYDNVSGGNLLTFDWLGNFNWLPSTIASGSSGVVTSKTHGFSNGDNIVFTNVFGGFAPTFTVGSLAGVCTASGVTTDTFWVISSGAVVNNYATTGDGFFRKIATQLVPSGVQPSFASGAFIVNAA